MRKTLYFLAAAFLATGLAFAGAAALAAGLATGLAAGLAAGLAGAAAGAGAAFNAVRWSRRVLISAASLFLRSVSLAMLAVILTIAFAVLETGAFLGAAVLVTGLATGFAAFAGAVVFVVVVAALGADFFAVAIFKFPSFMSDKDFCQDAIVAKLIALLLKCVCKLANHCVLQAMDHAGAASILIAKARFPTKPVASGLRFADRPARGCLPSW